uniref:Adaptor protein ClpS core domain-containing protein n=1 Tax=Rhodosorus marinus TaxID=101924 RepID=A0A7S2ZXL3_9RHOD|mmetsp:Transcript_36520/g.146030  ORF Transcript_36520/g.146030 Transcript_36520/m.146030 type:complete len:146 (+) Transcript_36520:622-1059(+)|eukprot:CAMPEP_0113965450 /NCGR_PEP_ID=MMETSP0011_2-20120614/7753_1 /TAXON_ID=101924 /ORGANISM="Rhodosorus marinus" /LENGTH=145 /DNA_ID=CAMNT_0000977967 /DNA_START=491 /DNA_END=928 /DNA_ORIENTATION=+ /assembly_acc=CAM_ASM_000156
MQSFSEMRKGRMEIICAFSCQIGTTRLEHNGKARVRSRIAAAYSPAPTIEKKGVKLREKTVVKEPVKPKDYNVFIINDPFNKREYVVKILLQTIPNMSFSRAYAVMDMAHTTGKGLVITTNMEMAEAYCEAITKAGILSTVEPAD